MGQILHACARTTEATRRAIQDSQESLRVLAGRYGINHKTVTKWRKREATRDPAMGPKLAKSTVLTVGEEARFFSEHRARMVILDEQTARILNAKAMAVRQTPSELLASIIHMNKPPCG